MRYFYLVLSLWCLSFAANAQTFHYVNGSLDITWTAFNPCGSPAPDNGYLQMTVNAANGGFATLIFLDGPGAVDDNGVIITVGSTYTFNSSKTLPDGAYDYIVKDQSGTTINSFATPGTYPAVILTDLASVALTQDILTNNTVCTNPTTGQIQSSITGGSKALVGGGSYNYTWSSTNGLVGLPLSGTTDGTTALNLATLLGVPGLPGGTYSLTVNDNYSSCGTSRSFTITDPSPVIQTITTPTPYNNCIGDDITITLNNTETGVTYTILRNGVATTNTFAGTGTGPFVMTFPSTGFSDNDVIQVVATNGFCSPSTMSGSVLIKVNPLPTITGISIPDVCQGSLAASMLYTGTTGSPSQYSIDFNATAEAQGFIDVTNVALPASPITITIPAGTAPGTYSATITVFNTATGCPSLAVPFSFKIIANPTITLGPNPSVCLGATTAGLTYTATAGSPNQYSINFDAAAEAAGFVDVPVLSLPASPITFNIPATAGTGVYNASITVSNSITGCTSISKPFTVRINAIPTITLGASPVVCSGTTTTLLHFTATSAVPDQYSIDYNAAAEAQGFVDVLTAILPTAPGNINLAVPAGATPGVYNATITVANTTTDCASPPKPFTVTINPVPTITLTNPNPSVCLGTLTANLPYSATSGSPTQYTLNFNAAAEAQGFVDITASLPASPISVLVPGAAAAGTYSATLTVRNATTTCVSAGLPVTITINPNPTITLTNANPQVCFGTSSVQFPYSATTGTPDQYSIVFNATALGAGFANVTNAALPAGQITVPIPGTASAAVYNGTLSIRNSVTGCVSSTQPISITINPTPTITLNPIAPICQGATSVNLPYSGVTGGANEYLIDFNPAAEAQGFIDVNLTVLLASPIAIPVPAGAAPGSYNATVQVVNSTTTCPSAPQTITITINPLPTATISGGGPVCAGSPLPNIVFTFTGTAPFTFTYTDGTTPVTVTNHPSTTFTITNAPVGNYAITALTDANTCVATSMGTPVNVVVNALPTAVASGGGTICVGGTLPDVTFTFTGTAPFTFTYTNGTTPVTVLNHPSTTYTIAGAPAGTYQVTALTDANTCTATSLGSSVSVMVNPLPTAVISGGGPVCAGATLPDVTFTFTGTAPFTFTYTDGTTPVTITNHPTTTFTIVNAPVGTYSISALTDANTCSATSFGTPVSVTINPLPTASIGGTNTICQGDNATLTFTLPATGTFNVVYTDGTINFTANGIANGATVSVSPSVNISYTIVSVTDVVTGCSATAPSPDITGSADITVTPTPTADISGTISICTGGNATLTFTLPATGTYDVVYTDGTTNFTATAIANGATVSVSPTATTTYTIVSVTTTGTTCTITSPNTNITGSAVITVTPLPTAGISGTTTICQGQNATLTFILPATGTYDVVYTDGTTNFTANNIANGATVSVSPAATISYTIVSVSDLATTCSVTAPSANITGSADITVTTPNSGNITGTATICAGTSTNLTFTLDPGTYDVVFTDGTTNFSAPGISSGATISVSPTTTVSYTIVSITNTASGCTVTAPSPNITGSADITVIPTPTADISGTVAICAGGNATLTFTLPATGTYDVVYTDGTTNFTATAIANGATVSVSPTATTTYTIVSVTTTGTACTITSPNTNITGSADITVTPLPTAGISGTTTICQGQNATLTFILPATGTYDVVYTDGTTNFTANGIANGATVSVSPAADISYTIVSVSDPVTTCSVTAPSANITGSADITVTPPNSGSISGTTTICSGSNANLSITLDPGIYDVVITDGTINFTLPGISNGAFLSVSPTATVTYTISSITNTTTGCTVTAPSPNITGSAVITVNPSPTGTMSGSTMMCIGSTTNIKVDFTGTGPWSFRYSDGTTTFGPFASPFNSINIPVNPSATTTFTLISVNDATACPGIINGSAEVIVNQPPQTNLAVGATINPLCNGGIGDVTVSNSEVGVSYQLRNNAGNTNVGMPVVGTGGTITLSTGPLTATTTFNVRATSGGCISVQLTNTVTINVAGSINAALAVTSDASQVCAGSAANILVANSENGVLYQLRDDATNALIGAAVPGTGASISMPTGTLSATTTFNVLASNGTCSIELTDKETVTVGSSPDATLAVNVSIDPLCAGGTSDVTVALSQNGVTYQLRNDADDSNVGTAVTGTGGTISFPTGVLNATTTFNVLATSTGCASVELTATATVNVSGAVDAGLTVSAADDPICANTGTDIQVDLSEAGVSYQLRDNATNALVGTAVAGTGATILLPTGNLIATTTFNVLASNGTCSIVLTNTATVNVDVAPDPTLTVGATLNPLCVGGTSDVTVVLSQVGVSYQLRDDSDDSDVGTPVAGTGGTILLPTGVLNTTTTFNVLATSGACTSVELTNLMTINVSGTLNAGLTVSASAATICAGSGTFVQVQTSETGVTYQLRNDATDAAIGSPIAGTGGTINLPTGNLSATTTFNIVANNGTCSIELTNKQTITVNPTPDLALAVTAAPAVICPGNSTSIVVANAEVGISYQLRNNAGNVLIGGPVAGTGANLSLSTGPLSSTTTFNVLAIAGTCSAQLTGTATVSVRLAGDPACGGTGGTDCTNFSAIVPTIVTQPSCNDRDAGNVSFTISRADGTPTTFRVIWTFNGGTPQTKFTSNTVAFNDLSSGLYQYTVIDEGNGKTCGPVDFFLDLKTQVKILTKEVTSNVTCYGGTDGNAILSVDGSTTGEYWYKYVLNGTESGAQTFTPGAPFPGGLPADDNAFIILKVDDNFSFTCPDTVMIRIKHTYPKIDFAVAATDVTTCNGTDGGIQVTGIGGGDSGTTPLQIRLKRAVSFTTDPTGYIVVSDFEDVAAGAKSYTDQPQGSYIVDIRDHLDCMQSRPIAIQAPGQVPLSSVSITAADANCANNGQSGTIRVSISDPGIYKVAMSQDQVNTPADADFVDYNAPGLPSVTFGNLASGVYYIYLKSSTTTCPTRTDAIIINGVKALADFEVLSNCENVNLTMNNITGQQDASFVIRVFSNNDKFFKIDSLAASAIPISNSVSFNYAAAQHTFLVNPGTYRFVMIQNQTTGTGTCTLVSDTVVYQVRELLGITLGQIKPSFPAPKHTGSIGIANISGGTRFVSTTNDLYYEISLTTADDDIVVVNWTEVKLDPQNKFVHLFDYLPQGVYNIKVRDAAGCVVTQVIEIPLDTSVYVPNMFTPNEDNINDEFEVLNLPIGGSHKLIITNRWGNEVFKSNDYRDGNFWTADGVADGVYFYRLKVDGGDTFTGWVEIIRGSKP